MSKTITPLQILQSLSEATAEIVSKTAPSVVTVNNGMGSGSGIIWSPDGYVVTASHVIGKRSTVEVSLGDGKSHEAKVIGRDPYTDIALLKIEAKTLKPIEPGDPQSLKPGQFILALANPFGRQVSATQGIITAVHGTIRTWGGITIEDTIITDARLNPGYSGGPLIDVHGRMIGLNTAYVWNRGIAVPIDTIKHIVQSLKNEGKIKRAYLGIVSDSVRLPEEVATQAQVNQHSGVMIYQVEAGSPAKKAGLAMGDVIIKFNDKNIENINDLHRYLTEEIIGKPTKLQTLRGENLTELTITPNAKTE
ncbi:MAG TPA: trypsin-like peptidase domain-containing protein [Candidatus Bathyarchaeia archaeon]|nr:trypsin-like peptidase domain-containing protein [Candidatus Bathyarchaeia archaeon]